jgi:hypothetical protein
MGQDAKCLQFFSLIKKCAVVTKKYTFSFPSELAETIAFTIACTVVTTTGRAIPVWRCD